MLFSSPDYPLFLGAIFLLYGLARSGGGLGLGARIGLMVLLGDVLFLLVCKRTELLWDPLGGLLLSRLAQGAAAEPWRYAVGTALLTSAVALGMRRPHWLSEPGPLRALGVALSASCVAIGVAVAVCYRLGSLDELSAAFANLGHLLYLAILGVAYGVAVASPASVATRSRGALLAMFGASSLFYLAWCVAMHGAYRYLLVLLLGTIALDFYLALALERAERTTTRRTLLVVSLVSNLGILAVFKYADFFVLEVLHLPVEPLGLILPAGISFHTFQSLSYTIDVYRKEIRATHSILEFATFVLFFPQLVAGPIVRARELLPQLAELPRFDHRLASEGLFRIALGLWKKIALADTLAITIVDGVFSAPERFSSVEVAAGILGYALQIYLDFSAYSDIAIGSAQLFGFRLPENFRTPYRSATLQEFWRRWHISLSTWLRDYLYIPLGGSRGTSWATYRNLLATMLLGGLWHGASWTFVVWGLLHGGGLAVARALEERAARGARVLRRAVVGCALAASLVAAGWWLGGDALRAAAPEALSGWLALAAGWLALTPPWAAATVLLSHVARVPWRRRSAGRWTRRVLVAARGAALAAVPALLLLLRHGDTELWVPAVTAALVLAALAAALEAEVAWCWANLGRALARVAATALVFCYVLCAWVFFRATSFDNALAVFRSLGAGQLDHANVTSLVSVALAAAVACHVFPDRVLGYVRERFLALGALQQGLLLAATALLLRELSNPRLVPFIYFQF